MNIVKNLIPKGKYIKKCPYSMSPLGITIHNTANSASAENEIAYMTNNNSETSYHFAVDEKEAIQALPLDRNGWHAGDGATGTGNRRTIAIEICRSTSDDPELFAQAEENTAQLCAQLCKQHGWTTKDIYTHQHWSGKNCPHKTLELGWERFLVRVNQIMQDSDKKGDFVNMTQEEKRRFVKDMYIRMLGRQVDSSDSGYQYWLSRLTDAANAADIITTFADSEEARQYAVKAAYRNLLGREVEAGGLEYWTEKLKDISVDQMYSILKDTKEYKNKNK